MKESAGYTLTEILIVLGVLSISALIYAQVSTQLDKSVRFPEAQINLGAVATAIRETVKYQSTCESALGGAVNSAIVPANILAGTQELNIRIPGILADGAPADDILTQNTRVQHLLLTNFRTINSVDLGGGKFFSELQLHARIFPTGMQLKPTTVGALFYTVVGGQIASCDSLTDDPVPLCEEMGCTWNPAASPACQCSPIDLSCPPQQFLTGVNASGGPICTALGAGPCPPNTYLRGVGIGTNDCQPLNPIPWGTPAVLTGVCGEANGGTYPDAATANAVGPLCDLGTESPASLSGAGPWSWTCSGVNGGSPVNCSAVQGAATPPPTCSGTPMPGSPGGPISPCPCCGLRAVGGGPCKKIGGYRWECQSGSWQWNEPYCECLL